MNHQDDRVFIRVKNLSKDYIQRRLLTRAKLAIHALQSVDLTIRRESTLAIVGESGSGKSTLVRCLSFIDKPTSGEIWWGGVNVFTLPEKELFRVRRRVQMVFQNPTSALNPGMTASEIVEEPLAIQRIGSARERRQRALELMKEVGLSSEWAGRMPMALSGGQRQRLAIARALALEPELIIFDEALSNLDVRNQQAILQLLDQLRRTRRVTYVHVAHDLRLVESLADEVAVMHRGEIVEHKRTPDLFRGAEHPHTKGLIAASPSLDFIMAERTMAECI